MIRNFTDLKAWQKGHKLVLQIYQLTENFPAEEKFGLTNQIRRAAVSVTSNIAEGFTRKTAREKIQFYTIALGSLTEIQNQLIIAKDLKYIDEAKFNEEFDLTIVVRRLISGIIKSAQNKSQPARQSIYNIQDTEY